MKQAIKKIIPFEAGVKLRGAYQKLLGFYYRGNNYYCPYCNHRFRKMLTGGEAHTVVKEKQIVGAGRRPNMVCPRCYSTDRDRLIYLYLKTQTSFLTMPAKVLHIAPEGSLKHFLENKTNLDYTTGDKFEEGYNDYYYDRDVVQMDVTKIPFDKNVFDLLICNHVLEHIEDDRQAMREMLRVLKPGGQAIVQVPIAMGIEKTEEHRLASAEERKKQYGQFDHVRLYAKDYADRLAEEGFKVEILNAVEGQWAQEMDQYAVNPDENIYIAKKVEDK